ncbi:MAG: hypothetical protein J6W96_06825 [Alphaproteobacteria bacterium]|nr:hypothetical protein [Alphaproteobacteria bacterium]
MKKKIIIATASGMVVVLAGILGIKRHQIIRWAKDEFADLKIFLKMDDWDE